jgi:prophage regulatory protein
MPKKILRLPGVKTTTGLSRSTIYLRVAEGSFPRPISLGARAVGWLEAEVEDWLSTQITRSREGAGVTPTCGFSATSRVDNSTDSNTQSAPPSETETADPRPKSAQQISKPAISRGITGQRALAGFVKRSAKL